MRFVLGALSFIVIGTVVGFFAYRELNAGLPLVLPSPASLQVTVPGASLQANGWTNSHTIELQVEESRAVAGADLEVRPLGDAFSNTPTTTVNTPGQVADACATCVRTGSMDARIRLADGSYHWQARLHNGQGISPWAVYRGTIHVDTQPPVVRQLASPSDPKPSSVYHTSTLRFTWAGSDSGSGVEGYAYRLDHDAHGIPRPELRTNTSAVVLQGLNTGVWYFHVRALDRVGNWGATVTFPVHIDVTPPGLTNVRFGAYQFDPQFATLSVSFGLTRPAQEVRVGVYRQSDNVLVRLYTLHHLTVGPANTVSWDGRDAAGHLVPGGDYEIYVRAIDAYGHASVAGWRDFIVDYKRILISLSQQKLWAYDGNSVVLTSLVTSGNQALPTPTGTFSILGKFHPFTFRSPWPKSSPYYYAPSPTQWAMLFREGGYFIHDAPWRSVFGPGSNAAVGTPGQNYTGTHGCVNVPSDVAQRLFAWAQIGTIVQVER